MEKKRRRRDELLVLAAFMILAAAVVLYLAALYGCRAATAVRTVSDTVSYIDSDKNGIITGSEIWQYCLGTWGALRVAELLGVRVCRRIKNGKKCQDDE